MVAAFEFFGAVPKEVWWDNPKTVATLILQGRERRLHPRYAALASHYVFDPRFCMPGRGNEKPDAESTVKAVQRRFATPVPRVADLDELNMFFRDRCEAERQRVVQSLLGPFTIGDRLAEDLAAATPLAGASVRPLRDPPRGAGRQVSDRRLRQDPLQRPARFAFGMVTVKGYVDRVVVAAAARSSRTHLRRLGEPMVLDPTHYLAALDRKPGALDHAPVFRDWRLPACFAAFRAELEEHHGAVAGARRFVRVLQLLGEHPLSAGEPGDRDSAGTSTSSVPRPSSSGRGRSRRSRPRRVDATATAADVPAAPQVHVPLPDLSRFDQFLGGPAAEEPVSVFF